MKWVHELHYFVGGASNIIHLLANDYAHDGMSPSAIKGSSCHTTNLYSYLFDMCFGSSRRKEGPDVAREREGSQRNDDDYF